MTAPVIHRPRVFLDLSHGEEPLGRLTIELFTDKTPKTCENFRIICSGSHGSLSYKASPFHRVIDEFMVQGGDITAGDGTGGDSIYDGEFEDENVTWREIDTEGLVCMANRGKGTNSSQFFITLTECSHLNGKHTIFGHLVSGQDVLQRMAKVDVDSKDRPLVPLLIAHCGELERRKKQPHPPSSSKSASLAIQDADRSRGRHKRRRSSTSLSRSRSQSRSKSPSHAIRRKKDRRRSEHSLDSTLRGRARKRGASSSISPVEEEESARLGRRRKHRKHHRSPSPSRGSEGERQGRRRSSLPNQDFHDRVGQQRNDGRINQKGEEGRLVREYGERRKQGYEGRDSEWYRNDKERSREEKMDIEDEGHGDRDRLQDEGRLGDEREDVSEGGIRFKGRGSMKYRERW